jgi:hypothetical protein
VDAWPYFPGLKVGQMSFYFPFLTILGGVDYQSLRNTIIPEVCG